MRVRPLTVRKLPISIKHTMELPQISKSAALLGLFAVLGTSTVAFVHEHTKARIAENERAYLLRSLHEIIPADAYDNDIINDTVDITNARLGNTAPKKVFLARKGVEPVGAIITAIAPRGYNGPITSLVGILYDGTIAGVRVISHRETPGLGDAIESQRSPWITSFNGRSIGDPPEQQWAVKIDGGVFDQFTGATITPRAVVEAVRETLIYFGEHREEIFAKLPAREAEIDG